MVGPLLLIRTCRGHNHSWGGGGIVVVIVWVGELDLQLPVQSVPITTKVVSSGTEVSSTNKTARHNTTEILLKVALNTIN